MTFRLLAAVLSAACFAFPVGAQDAPFGTGWDLDPAASSLRFQSVKNLTKVESSSFATLSGGIESDGTATVTVVLDSVDTGIDLRNVRMRFLFFETFEHPSATITAKIEPAMFADLAQVRRKTVPLIYTLDLHGVTQTTTAEVTATLITDDLVSVSSSVPISVAAADFDLENGVRKLEEAAGVEIVPSATVSFDFLFARASGGVAPQVAAVETTPAALEPTGNFDLEACIGRFEILSRTDNITFRSGSSVLDAQSSFILDSIVDIVARCPGLRIQVGGHTDADGGEVANLRLSERRAASVMTYLLGKGIDASRLNAIGFGEAQPVAPNDSAENKRRNRRIEFQVLNG